MELREIVVGSPEYAAAAALRNTVLREPLGLVFTPEEQADEPHNLHLAALAEHGELVGVLLLHPLGDGSVKMRQVAVASHWQGRGVGAQLVRFAEETARARGFSTMMAHARETAVPFYLRLGYQVEGEPFVEVTVPHRRVVKALR